MATTENATETGAWAPPASVARTLAGWTPCECGCGEETARRFRPGHDATLKSRLIRTVLTGERPKADAAAKAAGPRAEAELRRLGWLPHLALSRAARDRKAESRRKPAPAKAAPAPKAKAAKPAARPLPANERAAGSDGRTPDLRLRSRRGKLADLPKASQ